jgi:hypothetical protein
VLLGQGNRDAAQLEAIQAATLDPRQPEFKRLSEELKRDSR